MAAIRNHVSIYSNLLSNCSNDRFGFKRKVRTNLYSCRIQFVFGLYTKSIPAEYKLYSAGIQVVYGRNTKCIQF